MSTNYRIETLQPHTRQSSDSITNFREVPDYRTATYVFNSAGYGADLLALKISRRICSKHLTPWDN